MKLFLDCEFNGLNGELISMALVPEVGEPFYAVLDTNRMQVVSWVRQNVMPRLVYNHQGAYPIDAVRLPAALGAYLSKWDEVTVVADWFDDFKYLMQALIVGPGTAVPTPKVFNMELRRDIESVSELPHNALADALAIRDAYEEMK